MKTSIITIIAMMILFSTLVAQTPQAFKYQTIVRNNTGAVLNNKLVSFQIGIMRDSLLMVPSYYETHTDSTNDFGLISLEIGTGIPTYGLFDTINWGSDDYHIEIGLDTTGGTSYVLMGTIQLLAVPYALYAEHSINNDDDWIKSGDYIYTISDSVGIGTATPRAKLEVAGHIWQSNIGYSVFIGEEAGENDELNNSNVFIGYHAGKLNTGGSGNTFVGNSSGEDNTTGHSNTFVGIEAGINNTNGEHNTNIGSFSSYSNTNGDFNTTIGSFSNLENHTGSFNTSIGYCAGGSYTPHNKSGNIFLGYMAGFSELGDNKLYIENSDADSANALIYGEFDNDVLALNARVGIGTSNPGATLDVAGPIWQTNTGQSVILGEEAGLNDDGNYNNNVFVGYQAGKFSTNGSYNTFIGHGCGRDNNTGAGNVFIGEYTGYQNTVGEENTFIGRQSSTSNISGSGNVVVGNSANSNNLAGSNNTILGYQAGSNINNHNKSGNVFIGYRAGAVDTTDNKLYIENSFANSSNALIYGEFDNDILAFNANVGINTVFPEVPLQVANGNDATLSGGGYLVSGQIASTNLVFDDNEIVARNNGDVSYLFVNRDGGNIILNQFDGNVGIGTVNPYAKLHLNGAMRLGAGVRDYELLEVDPSYPDGWSPLISYGGIGIGSNDGTNRQMFMFTDGSTTDNIFTVATSQNNGASWEADLVIRQDGNIGINTSTPARKLHVSDVMRLEPRSSAPSGASAGDLYFDGITHKLRCYDGSSWQDCW